MPRPGRWIHSISTRRDGRLSVLRHYLHLFRVLSELEGELHQSLRVPRTLSSARPLLSHGIIHEWMEDMHYPDGTCAIPSTFSDILIADVLPEVDSIFTCVVVTDDH